MKILITGSNGFIGKNCVEQLSDKYSFIKVSHTECDLRYYPSLAPVFEKFEPDAVLHCAAKPGHRLATDLKDISLTNLQMFTAVLKCVNEFKIKKFISIGSGSEFSMDRNLDNVTEESVGDFIPKDETGFPRYIINSLITQNKNAVNMRCFGVFGKYEDYNMRFISNAIVKAMFDKEIAINENKNFSYLYVNDLVKIIDIFLNNDLKFSDYNITPGYVYSMTDIAGIIKKVVNSKSNIKVLGSGFNYTGSNKRFTSEFDFKFTPLESAITELYNYYISIKNELKIT